MPRMNPVHSVKKTDRMVYHNNSACHIWNNIETENRRKGGDGRPLCYRCAELNRQGEIKKVSSQSGPLGSILHTPDTPKRDDR